MRLEKLHEKHGETIPDYALIEMMQDVEFNAQYGLRDKIKESENAIATAKKLLDAALTQMPDKQGGTRCKTDMASNVLKQELLRINEFKFADMQRRLYE